MELDFHKEKQRIAEMSDAELVAQTRNASISSTDRMLVEAEISRRGLDRRRIVAQGPRSDTQTKSRSNPIGLLVFVVIALSIVSAILDDMGFDVIQWLRDLFSD
ncbi:MAG: hypothetical protein OER80_11055 [Gammaproteobacteria bacterium]|nr:hypothetical protein [Gammaproteobacteria bacterium]MDH3767095.1 hypothetical protein [Gammaproteobacteria bacterium]